MFSLARSPEAAGGGPLDRMNHLLALPILGPVHPPFDSPEKEGASTGSGATSAFAVSPYVLRVAS
jgi:hypothetical protein